MKIRRLIDRVQPVEKVRDLDPELAKLVPLLMGIVRQARNDANKDPQARAWLEELQGTTTKRVRRVA